jgi:hypothetical protein
MRLFWRISEWARRIKTSTSRARKGRRPSSSYFGPAVELLEERWLLSAGAAASAFGHITDGKFDIINGHQEWSDVQPVVFATTQSYLYADQANLNHPAGSPPDTFMLMYDEVGMTTPLGPNQSFRVSFTTVEHEDGHDRLNFYTDQIFPDGTITFLENGVVQHDASGNTRVTSIGGQQGQAGFGPSPNASIPHVIAEFQIALSANQTVLNGGYSPDPQFWTSDPPPPPPPPPPYKLSFYVQGNNPFETGHAFAQLVANSGPNAGDVNTYGHYPNSYNPFDSSGLTRPNGDHPWDWKIAFPVTAEQYNTVATFINNEINNPSDYHLLTSNCTDWVDQIANMVGLPLPAFTDPYGVSDPVTLDYSLASIGDGGSFGGGTVSQNTNGTLPNNNPDPPPPFPDEGSVNGFISAALANAPAFAQTMNLVFHQETLPPVAVGVGQTITVNLANVDLNHAVAIDDFSDGTPATQSLTAAHLYQSPGTRHARAIVINGGAVDEFFFDVNVGAGVGSVSESIQVPDAPPNAPFVTPPTPPLIRLIPPPPPSAILPGFDAHVFPGNDDGSTGPIPLGFTADFFGNSYSSLFVNNNGDVTFDSPLSAFTPFDLSSTQHAIIAPFFADVDTRIGNAVTYGTGTVDGHQAFGVTWPDVGHYFANTQQLDAFQVVLVDRSDTGTGNFDIEFNYGQIQWETGDASGGVNGLGGFSARAGFSNGTGLPGTFLELPGSGVNGAFLDSNSLTGLIHNSVNSQEPGQYVYSIRGGAPETHTTAAFLQANLDGTTTVVPTSPLIGQEPTIADEIVRIVEFRVQAGLTNSAGSLTTDLVNGLVADGLVSPQQATALIANVFQQIGIVASPVSIALSTDHPLGSVYGQSDKFTAIVSAVNPSAGTPTGVVQFLVDGANFGSAVALNNGSASFSTALLSAGGHVISATYTSDNAAFLDNERSTPVTQSVAKAHLSVVANDATKIIGAANPPLTAKITGFVNGESLATSGVTGIAALGTAANPNSRVGTYTITAALGTLTASNYDFLFTPGKLLVTYGMNVQFDQTKPHQSNSDIPVMLALADVNGANLSSDTVEITVVGIATFANPGVLMPAKASGNANPGNRFRHTGNGYTYNLKTTGLASGTYLLIFSVANDPVLHSVQFVIR